MNRVEITPEMETACSAAKAALGGPVALAKALSDSGRPITSQAVGKWRAVPPEWVLEVERLTSVSRHRQRPDVFGVDPAEIPEATELAANEVAAE